MVIPIPQDYRTLQHEAHLKMNAGLSLSPDDHAALFHHYKEAAEQESLPSQRHLYERYRDFNAKKYSEKLAKVVRR